jgi:YidC/Oxa1 family membrane protein insertase
MFELFISFFNIVLYQPLFNALVFLYEFLPYNDFGIAVIVLTILIRLILYPLGTKGIKAQKALSELQPKMKEIQEKFKNDKEKQAKAMMELYKKEKINPLSGCLPILIQLPIIIALYRVFWKGLQPEQLSYLYSFVPSPGVIDSTFLGIIDLSKSFIVKMNGQVEYYWPVVILALLAGILQFFQAKMVMPQTKKKTSTSPQFSDMMQKQMLYFFPAFTIFIVCSLPSAIGLYWVVFTLFAIIQQHFTLKPAEKDAICLNKKN